ncbi:enhancer of mRNA-decapping protein 3 isoform X2 [Maylandia zebra]|uniref:Enhancer of mRNA-decapping protein 3 n=1 Tax=Pundamilia nyererei TaxID=303518 RepID=A0A9Y3QY12_9CICH|nr:enhancer of mRNA-decapping protein 3 isoform X2 [Maylandia zebra]XP_005727649.1 PREDICTED: enhancer of mRNA-decapping protein 3 isoform X2 [Pundamilia nyererei]XP_026030179.1 enhancer of mRNA-decapping protein 3 isoform X2 [Astatotilapia calliptera]
MATDWVGSVVSIDCGATLGVYQGEVSSVDRVSQTISLKHPYHNGVKCPVPEVTFSAMDIKDLKFLDIQNKVNKTSAGKDTATEPSYISTGRHGQTNKTNHSLAISNSSGLSSNPRKGSSNSRGTTQSTPRRSNIDGASSNSNKLQHHNTQAEQKTQSYRHDENILEVKPVTYRQITVPQHGGKEYCTDTGLVVPTVPYELHKQLLAAAERWGLSLERRLEAVGVCSSQMALTLLGGPNRLTPKNVHQRPTVVLLCGPHVQGAQGISCGRHLANHEVEVILFLPNFVKMQESVTSEVNLFSKTSGKQVSSVKDLPMSPVDLVINCLDCHENPLLKEQSWYQSVADWANKNRAPVLSIDPPVSEQPQSVDAKWTLSLGLPLPLADKDSRVYLCDIGLPKMVYQEVGINYHSPFGCKFVIPLHSV